MDIAYTSTDSADGLFDDWELEAGELEQLTKEQGTEAMHGAAEVTLVEFLVYRVSIGEISEEDARATLAFSLAASLPEEDQPLLPELTKVVIREFELGLASRRELVDLDLDELG